MMRLHGYYIEWNHRSYMLWTEAQQHINKKAEILVVDDSTLDKFYAKKMELVKTVTAYRSP